MHRLAIRYVERYATSRKKLGDYLHRKIREREWRGAEAPAIEPLIERFVEQGYIDDALYAQNKASALIRRGYGTRRVSQALYQAGISETDGREAYRISETNKLAGSGQICPQAAGSDPMPSNPAGRRSSAASNCRHFLRAGHDFDLASNRFVFAKPGEEILPEDEH